MELSSLSLENFKHLNMNHNLQTGYTRECTFAAFAHATELNYI